jgi:hypothetical protein
MDIPSVSLSVLSIINNQQNIKKKKTIPQIIRVACKQQQRYGKVR